MTSINLSAFKCYQKFKKIPGCFNRTKYSYVFFTNYYNNKAENERERGRGCEYW